MKPILAIIAMGFLLVSFVGAGLIIGSHMKYGDCPFMPMGTAICSLGILTHISAWQSLFAAIVSKISLLDIVFTLIVAFGVIKFTPVGQDPAPLYFFESFKKTKLFDYLLISFRRGLLHPKIYG